MSGIAKVMAREILDSRGHPTVEVDVVLKNGAMGRAAVPSGASRGKHEAAELRDRDPSRFRGLGVQQAVAHVRDKLGPALIGLNAQEQACIDQRLVELDGSPSKSRVGANAILGISLAVAKAAAKDLDLPLYRYLGGAKARRLPMPLFNVLNGGLHADSGLPFQEFMVIPIGARTMAEAVRMGAEVFLSLREVLQAQGHRIGVGDEGGYAPALPSVDEAFRLLLTAIEQAGYRPGRQVALALDCAASHWRRGGRYHLQQLGHVTATRLIEHYATLAARYPIVSIEDGLDEEDWTGWQALTRRLGRRIQLVGDDIFVTNLRRLERGIALKAATAILIKPNQIGTLTETLAVVQRAKQAGWLVILSHRSGETEDTVIADLAVAWGASQIKSGSLARSERVAKYNQLLRIEEELGATAEFARWPTAPRTSGQGSRRG